MGYSFRKKLPLLFTPLGPTIILRSLDIYIWPLFYILAKVYRRTVKKKLRVVAVVGSSGKTTTTIALRAALGLELQPKRVRNARTSLAAALLTTRSQNHAVMEVGIFEPGQMKKYSDMLRPDIVVVTSIGGDHGNVLGGPEEIREEKALIVRSMPDNGFLALNGDDPHVLRMADYTKARVVTFGFDQRNDVRAEEAKIDWPHGTTFTLHTAGIKRHVRVKLVGRHMVYPILAAVAVALEEGINIDDALSNLKSLNPVPGRMQIIKAPSGAMLLRDDYKASVENIDVALDALAEISARRKIVVLGCVEPYGYSSTDVERLGKKVAMVADRAYFVGDCRESYISGAKKGEHGTDAIVNCGDDISSVIQALRFELKDGDVVLIKGRIAQRLSRISLALEGNNVNCYLAVCYCDYVLCETCPMVGRG